MAKGAEVFAEKVVKDLRRKAGQRFSIDFASRKPCRSHWGQERNHTFALVASRGQKRFR